MSNLLHYCMLGSLTHRRHLVNTSPRTAWFHLVLIIILKVNYDHLYSIGKEIMIQRIQLTCPRSITEDFINRSINRITH